MVDKNCYFYAIMIEFDTLMLGRGNGWHAMDTWVVEEKVIEEIKVKDMKHHF